MELIQTDIVVIGAGPGGYAAAFYAADLGKKVILIERDPRLGGVCMNRGCIPSKALLNASHVIDSAKEAASRGIQFGEPTLDLDKLRTWKESILQKLGQGIAGLARMRGVTVEWLVHPETGQPLAQCAMKRGRDARFSRTIEAFSEWNDKAGVRVPMVRVDLGGTRRFDKVESACAPRPLEVVPVFED